MKRRGASLLRHVSIPFGLIPRVLAPIEIRDEMQKKATQEAREWIGEARAERALRR